jgi:hypothetical protein
MGEFGSPNCTICEPLNLSFGLTSESSEPLWTKPAFPGTALYPGNWTCPYVGHQFPSALKWLITRNQELACHYHPRSRPLAPLECRAIILSRFGLRLEIGTHRSPGVRSRDAQYHSSFPRRHLRLWIGTSIVWAQQNEYRQPRQFQLSLI